VRPVQGREVIVLHYWFFETIYGEFGRLLIYYGSTVFNGKIFFTTKDTTLAPHCVGCSAGEVTKEKSP
jgi:hypothetical protein